MNPNLRILLVSTFVAMSLIPSIKAQAQVASNSGSGRNNQQAGIVTGIAPGKPAQISSNTGTGTNVQQLGGVIPPTGPVPDSNLPSDINGPIPPIPPSNVQDIESHEPQSGGAVPPSLQPAPLPIPPGTESSHSGRNIVQTSTAHVGGPQVAINSGGSNAQMANDIAIKQP